MIGIILGVISIIIGILLISIGLLFIVGRILGTKVPLPVAVIAFLLGRAHN